MDCQDNLGGKLHGWLRYGGWRKDGVEGGRWSVSVLYGAFHIKLNNST